MTITFMPKFFLTHLYPIHMSIYGDMGNIITLRRKLKVMGFEVIIQNVNPGDSLPEQSDFYFIGGGQDNDQYLIFQDLLTKKTKLLADIEAGVPLFSICGGYQLLGNKFVTGEGKSIEGINLFPVDTKSLDASVSSRCIGNLVVELDIDELKGQKMVGFENHGGQTYIIDSTKAKPLGKVIVGYGNNSIEKLEGCIYKNAIGSYCHGSCLPKNPNLANWFIKQAITTKNALEGTSLSTNTSKIDDTIALKTQNNLITRWTSKA
jgi:lipid II isoglutaminyl synthase (glutamine-hydrolysing)